MMDEALLAALLIGWAAVLLPSALRSRRETDPQVTVGGFTQAMAVLRGRPDGREIMVPGQADRIVSQGQPRTRPVTAPPRSGASRRSDVVARRRTMFVRLLAATIGTFVLAVVVGGLLWPMFVTTAMALGGYVAMLRHFKLEADEARAVVRTIDLTPHEVAPDRDVRYREPVAVGAEPFGFAPHADTQFQVATRPDTPWQPQSSVRIRRWDA